MIKRKQSHLIITTNFEVQSTYKWRFYVFHVCSFNSSRVMNNSQLLNRCCRVSHADYSHERDLERTMVQKVEPESIHQEWFVEPYMLTLPFKVIRWMLEKNKKSLRFSVFLGSIYFSFEIVCWRQLRTFQHQNMFLYCPRYRRIIHWTVWYDKRFMRHEWMKSEGNGKFIFRILLIQ